MPETVNPDLIRHTVKGPTTEQDAEWQAAAANWRDWQVTCEGLSNEDFERAFKRLFMPKPVPATVRFWYPIGPWWLWWLTARLPVYRWEEHLTRFYQVDKSMDGVTMRVEAQGDAPLILRSGIRWGWDWKRSVAGEEENQ